MSQDAAFDRLAAVVLEDPSVVVARAVQMARDALGMEVAYLAELNDSEQCFGDVEGDGSALGVEAQGRMPRSEAYCDRLIAGLIPNVVPDTTRNPATADLALTQAGVRCYVGVPVLLPDGRLEGTLCCLSRAPNQVEADRDLTFMRVLARLIGDELQRRQLRGQLDRHREELIAMASHDLKNPVTTVVGYAGMLAQDKGGRLGETEHSWVDAIERAGHQLDHLADQLLFIARADADRLATARDPIDLATVAREASDQARPAADVAGVALTAEASAPVPVTGDHDQLLRLAQNLVGNAVKYTPEGGAATIAATRDGNDAVLTVHDSGQGIPLDEQDRVFDRFFRASNRDGAEGTGLGLAIVREVAERHDGSLELHSVVGEGTTVTFRLPATVA